MGLTKVTTRLTGLANPKKSFESLFLVDTGRLIRWRLSDEFGEDRGQEGGENGV